MILQLLTKNTNTEKSSKESSKDNEFVKKYLNDTPLLNKEFEKYKI